MARRKMEEIIEDLRNEGLDDYAEELGQYTGSALRRRADELQDKADRADGLEKELAEVRRQPEREKALQEAGVDITVLSPLERKAINASGFDPAKDDEVTAFIEENELAVVKPTEVEGSEEKSGGGEESEAAKVAAQARRGVGATGPVTLKGTDMKEWPTDRLMKFRENHPDEWEALKKGEEVTLPA